MTQVFEYPFFHPWLLFLPAVFFFSLPPLAALVRAAKERHTARQRAEAAREAAAKKQAAPKIDRAEAMRAVIWQESAPARKRGRPRKHPAPDPDTPKRMPGRPRKNPAPAQRPEIISSPTPAAVDLEEVANRNLYTPEDFLKHIG